MRLALQETFEKALNGYFSSTQPPRIGVAVSGGGDSIALLLLAAKWARVHNSQTYAVTVDHGLRDGSLAEAKTVGELCLRKNIPHQILTWSGWDGNGNLQNEARRARLRLIADWAKQNELADVFTGHTKNDQAETVLMRLGRGSGLHGLSAMAPTRSADGIAWRRPLLSVSRDDLRQFLRQENQEWVEDPSNEDSRFDRVKARKALTALEPLGISIDGLAATATRLATTRDYLDQNAHRVAKMVAKVESGDVLLHRRSLFDQHAETRRLLINHALKWISNADYAPRQLGYEALEVAINVEQTMTLHGCLVTTTKDHVRIAREYNEVSSTVCNITEKWDNRWSFRDASDPDLVVAAVGEMGLRACPNWRESELPRTSLLSSPGLWNGDELVAAPLAGLGSRSMLKPGKDEKHFFSTILSH